jgi:hypothetical protein
VAGLADLEARRGHELRLRPDRALESLDEAAAWLQERGLLTLMPCCSLPSLFAACHEEPYEPGKRGFAQWPKTKYWWPFALSQRPGVHSLKIHRGKTLIVSEATALLADPLARAALAEAEEGAYGEDAARLVGHLAAAGPSLLDDLRAELGAVKRPRERLERVGAIVARAVEAPQRYLTELSRWDQAFPEPSPGGSEELVAAAVRAAVLAQEDEVAKWFSWPVGDAVDRLIDEGRLARVDGYVTLASGS